MRISIFTYSRRGVDTAIKIREGLGKSGAVPECRDAEDVTCYTLERYAAEGFYTYPEDTKAFYGECFERSDALIFVGAAGIAVRKIAPFVKSKLTDPAVICVDELGHFVIPILSGHIGGANSLAARISEMLGATAVITTATDINHRFSVDSWASKQGLVIDDMKIAKDISSAILERDIPVVCQCPVKGELPSGLFELDMETAAAGDYELGIYIGWRKSSPFSKTLHLIPVCLSLGLGCRRNTEEEAIASALEKVFGENLIDKRAVLCAASIDLKENEEGLLSCMKKEKWNISFYTAEELSRVTYVSCHSDFVKSITGVDNVCERSALMQGDRLIVNKTAINGVTVALAEKAGELKWEN